MLIRLEEPGDVAPIGEVVRSAFAGAAHRSGTEHAIVDNLRAAEVLSISLVAVEGATIVGHVAVSPVVSEDGVGQWYGLGPVSVRPDRQLRGVGSALVREALERLRTKFEADGCVVVGDPGYYSRFGFKHDPAAIYRDVPPPYFQVLAFKGRRLAGAVEYHPAFDKSG
jgi:putative acetyltransferase